jgi:hypothetical protein
VITLLHDLELPAGEAMRISDAVGRHGDTAVGHEVGIIPGVAVQRGERSLEEGRGDRGSHVRAGVEQFGREGLRLAISSKWGRSQ